ncbi:MAG: ABC transporter permease [Ferruginibacter sp.]
MLLNYLKIAFRNLQKHKSFSAINIFGLAIGIATCLLITLYVLDELSYDKYNDKADRIYRVNVDIKFGGADQKFAVASAPLAFTMVKDYPQVESAVRFRNYGSSVVKKGEQNIRENRVIYVDSTLFSVFSLPIISGDKNTALTEPNSVVITNSMAEKYFGATNPLGKIMRFDNRNDFKVTGVIKDVPENSHFNFDFFISMAGMDESRNGVWASFNFNTYLLLRKDVDPKAIVAKMEETNKKYLWPQVKQMMNVNPEEFIKSGNYINLSLIPVKDIHLQSDRLVELAANNDVKVIYIFSLVAVLILIIACINFMNLSTARSANRAKEVGVRKVLGTQRSNLISQFITESVLMSLLAFALALGIAALLMPYFNQIALKKLTLSPIEHPVLIPILLGFALLVGLLAGSYPAFYLSAFKPIQVLKGNLASGFKHSYLRSSLVVFQFAISIGLIVGTIVIYNQLTYIQNKKLGFNKEQVLIVQNAYVLDKQTEAFKNEVLKFKNIQSASVSGFLPIPSSRSDQPFFPEGEMDQEKAVAMQQWAVDHDYIKTLGMEMKAGRNFSHVFLTDSSAVVVNETAAKLFGFKEPVGKTISSFTDVNNPTNKINFKIIGVVKNFHFSSLRENIGALCMVLGKSTDAITFRINAGNTSATVKDVEAIWKKMAPSEPFTFSFLNEDFNTMYKSEQRIGKIFITFAILAILIACLGLFGLATYSAEQRTKEIGIRKVLGASVANIVRMLSKDFLKLVAIAALIAFPIAWWAMHNWLQNFAYRIEIKWWVFIAAGVITLFIALATIGYKALRSAINNPVKSLRSE